MSTSTITIRTEELAGYQNTIARAREQIAALKLEVQAARERMAKGMRLAEEVAKDYDDSADWKDARGRLQALAQDALGEEQSS